MASQRVEKLTLEILGYLGYDFLLEIVETMNRKERGSFFGVVESMILLYVISKYETSALLPHNFIVNQYQVISAPSGLIWREIKSLYDDGLLEYVSDLWNILDFCSNLGYVTWIALRLTAFYIVHVSKCRNYFHNYL